MASRKYNTLNNVNYVIDRRGKLYLNEYGRIKRSTTEFYYEVATSVNGGYWEHNLNNYTTRKEAMDFVKSLVRI